MDTVLVRYGNVVDFSFIVSLYVSDLLNVTIKYSFCFLCIKSAAEYSLPPDTAASHPIVPYIPYFHYSYSYSYCIWIIIDPWGNTFSKISKFSLVFSCFLWSLVVLVLYEGSMYEYS